MSAGIGNFVEEAEESDSLNLKVTTVEYADLDSGTLVHLFGRDEDGERYHVEVDGHDPSFYIHEDEYDHRVDNHYAVKRAETIDSDGNNYESLHGEPLVRIYTHKSSSVGDLRETFAQTWEADVMYDVRFLIDTGIKTGVRIDLSGNATGGVWKGDYRVDIDDLKPLTSTQTPDVRPKQVVIDIEVGAEDGVPDTSEARAPVTTIVGWDSYSEEYIGWILDPTEHSSYSITFNATTMMEETGLDDVRQYDNESSMLDDFNQWLESQRPDILTGWYSSDFDVPYLINRCRNLNTYSYRDWSPLGDVYETHYEPVVAGVECIDMLEGYKKTQIHKLQSKALEDVAQEELGMEHHAIANEDGLTEDREDDDALKRVGKVDIDLSHTEMWKQNPVEFLRYNKVDVELVHRIDESAGVIDLLDHIRTVAGCSLSDPVGGNFEVMDSLFLRRAKEYGLCLPTAGEPDKGWYYGAKVFDPTAGLHENVVYMDISSLYPSLIRQLNVSPETISEDEPDECSVSYVDYRADSVKKDSQPETDELYYDTSTEGFVASLVEELIEMKNEYRGTDMYESVKRCTNSVYGVLSDSDSYGSGFRLFDWRMGESITLAGRMVIEKCADLCLEWCAENGYEGAEITIGDTDGIGIALPSADDMDEALRVGYEMEQYVNEQLPSISQDLFDIDESDNEIEIECESYASRVFVKGEDDGKSDVGVRKKYAQRLRWEK